MINVFNIEKFATHDGPGIRTTIFLKGCNLHCPWCANPESWSLKPTLMYDLRKCIKCKKCVNACKQKAISFDKKFLYDRLKCIYCKKCSESCLTQALTFAGKELSINTIVDEVMKDKDYFDNSNGGITISGGEPFVQFEAMMKLIKALKKQNLHIAMAYFFGSLFIFPPSSLVVIIAPEPITILLVVPSLAVPATMPAFS